MLDGVRRAGVRIFSFVSTRYIEYVYKTSEIILNGDHGFYKSTDPGHEKYVICFWHGDSYCYYPMLRDDGIVVITTSTYRGAYISEIAKYFGYRPIRVPNETTGEDDAFSIKTVINQIRGEHVAITLDGPYGPYHEPKKFALVTSLVSKKKIQLISVNVKKAIHIKKRWDLFQIPLPFNTIEFNYHEPFAVTKDGLDEAAEKIAKLMDA